MRPRIVTVAACFGIALVAVQAADARDDAPPAAPSAEFFEKKIRPVLAAHCYQCHSADAQRAKKLKAGLLLDSRDGLLRGGDSGPAVVPGKPDDSRLIQALRHAGDLKMPPKGKLPESVIADFERWVALGAPAPRAAAAGRKAVGLSNEQGRSFWAYRPLRKTDPPAVRDATWPAGDIDRFILARLEAVGLTPAGDADRPTLARRLYYDLTGQPPTPEEVDAFARDSDPLAYEKLVDRLLASPGFGERWGRHWLDIARFAESVTLRGMVLKEAWRYRDYVIDAFDRDVPFDRFIREQIAGDLLPTATVADRCRQLVATTFLTLGNTNLEEQDKRQLRMDVVDEQLDVIAKGFLAQTVTCARCHDHKFDPIPTRDYYALAGILRNAKALEHANVSKWVEVPLPVEPAEEARLREHERAVAALQARIKDAKAKAGGKAVAGRGVLAVGDVPGVVVDDTQAKKVGEWKDSQHSGTYIGRGYVHDLNAGKGEKTLTFQPELPAGGEYEVWLAYSHGNSRAAAVPVTVFSADGEKTVPVDMRKPPPIDGRFVSLGRYQFERNGQGFVIIATAGTTGHVTADALVFLPTSQAGLATKTKAPPKATGDAIRKLEAELKKLQESGPKRPMVMSVVEEGHIEDARVHIRGSVHTLGELAPRGFLQVATIGAPPTIPANESGRRQLADWIAAPDNPLTARVIVNRAWHWLFGAGLVRTTDNFGTTGEPPSHPELLDYLAVRFVEDGWSVKRLVRAIVLSRTYRQKSATGNPRSAMVDPENRLLARQNRRRLDAECIRDTLLAVGGQLRRDRGGPTFPPELASDFGYRYADTRRSVYAPVFRNALPELFEAFDFADPSVVTGRRNVSTVAPQALLLLNHPFVVDQARAAAGRLLAEGGADDGARLVRAYRLCLGRAPTDGERRVGLAFLRSAGDPREAWARVVQALFASADFRYLN
jgi:cytochrome c553